MKKAILFLCLLCCVIPPAKGIRPDRTYVRLPEHLGLIYKTLDVCTQDGYRIRTWFFPAQEASRSGCRQRYAACLSDIG